MIALLSELGLAIFDNQTERDLTADNLGECNLLLNNIIINIEISISISNIVLTADNFSRCKLRLNVNLTSITLFRFCGFNLRLSINSIRLFRSLGRSPEKARREPGELVTTAEYWWSPVVDQPEVAECASHSHCASVQSRHCSRYWWPGWSQGRRHRVPDGLSLHKELQQSVSALGAQHHHQAPGDL